ncbi:MULTISPECIES: hypothetical protein [Lysobacter]|uniref:hypothetical protein n=1 Tax=Lysobacteraceae TaxID=32033 RepID=UPI000AF61818|nr:MULTISPECIES: hypothetical protein [Lysobacter]
MDDVRDGLERRQIPIYFSAIPLGFAVALTVPGTGRLEVLINPALALMLFVTFLQVPLVKLRAALANRRFLGALLVANFVVVPLLVATMLPLLPAEPLIRIAVLFVLLCPCIDYVVTFSHLGKADSSLLLAATPVLLLVQMLLLPVYLGVLMGAESASLVRAGPFLHAFVWLIAVPLLLAAGLQAAASRSPVAARIAGLGGVMPVPATAGGALRRDRSGDTAAWTGRQCCGFGLAVLHCLRDHRTIAWPRSSTDFQAGGSGETGRGVRVGHA